MRLLLFFVPLPEVAYNLCVAAFFEMRKVGLSLSLSLVSEQRGALTERELCRLYCPLICISLRVVNQELMAVRPPESEECDSDAEMQIVSLNILPLRIIFPGI